LYPCSLQTAIKILTPKLVSRYLILWVLERASFDTTVRKLDTRDAHEILPLSLYKSIEIIPSYHRSQYPIEKNALVRIELAGNFPSLAFSIGVSHLHSDPRSKDPRPYKVEMCTELGWAVALFQFVHFLPKNEVLLKREAVFVFCSRDISDIFTPSSRNPRTISC
jgi:hypothetical protein